LEKQQFNQKMADDDDSPSQPISSIDLQS